jgi:hypothetical protein
MPVLKEEDLYHQIFDEQHNVKKEVSQPLGQDFPAYAKGDLFVYWDHKPRMPWQTPEYYVSQKQQLRLNTYLRLHENRWEMGILRIVNVRYGEVG